MPRQSHWSRTTPAVLMTVAGLLTTICLVWFADTPRFADTASLQWLVPRIADDGGHVPQAEWVEQMPSLVTHSEHKSHLTIQEVRTSPVVAFVDAHPAVRAEDRNARAASRVPVQLVSGRRARTQEAEDASRPHSHATPQTSTQASSERPDIATPVNARPTPSALLTIIEASAEREAAQDEPVPVPLSP